MKELKWQVMVSCLFAALTRGMGFVLRVVVSRNIGSEALGIMEMASGVQQLLLTPLIAGLPLATSRLTALEKGKNVGGTLYTVRKMAWKRGWAMAILCVAGAPFFALVLGDMRTVPALVLFAPALPLVSLSCVMDGYAFGRGRAFAPAFSEFLEQVVRIAGVMTLLTLLPALRLPLRAAVPVMAGVLGEGAGLMVMVIALRGCARPVGDEMRIRAKLDRLSLPMMGSRLGMSGLRSLTGVLMPRLLVSYGLSSGGAASQMGLLQGMVMPLLFLPGVFTGALATLGGPRLAACRDGDKRRMAGKLISVAFLAGFLSAVALYAFASLIGEKVYRDAHVAPLLRFMAPGTVLIALNHILSAIMTGLGQQKALFYRQMVGGAGTLGLTVVLTVLLGIYGTGLAIMLGQILQCTLNGILLWNCLDDKTKKTAPEGTA